MIVCFQYAVNVLYLPKILAANTVQYKIDAKIR